VRIRSSFSCVSIDVVTLLNDPYGTKADDLHFLLINEGVPYAFFLSTKEQFMIAMELVMGVIAEVISYFSPEHDVKPSITSRADRIWNAGGGSTPKFCFIFGIICRSYLWFSWLHNFFTLLMISFPSN
jgi:hypothetical protein